MKIFYSFFILLLICSTSYAKRLDEMNANTSPDITNDLIYSQDVSDTSENSHGTGKSLTIKNALNAGKITVDGTNVGINSTSPTAQLDIIGSIKLSGSIDTALTAGECVQTTTNGVLTTTGSACGSGGGGSVSDVVYGVGWDGDTTVAPSKNAIYDKIETISAGAGGWTDGGTNIYNTTTSDNVGIGTLHPQNKLHVYGSETVTGTIDTGGQSVLTFNPNGEMIKNTTDGYNDFSGGIISVGNVGVGTTIPLQPLDVTGAILFRSLTSCDTIDTDSSGNLSCGTDSGGGGGVGVGTVNPGNAGYISYYPSSGTTVDDLSVIYSNGTNVGVGTINPSKKLHVTGDARITGLVSCDTIDTDSSGNLSCGTDGGGGGGISNVVEDTTPQLGGDLDMNGKNIDFPSTPNISDVLDEDNMASDSATKLATQQSIKAYVDTAISGVSGGAGGWTDNGTTINLTTSTDTVGIGTTSNIGSTKLQTVGPSSSNGDDFIGLFVENGVSPEASALTSSGSTGKAVGVQGDGGAYYLGRDVTNNIEFIMGTSITGVGFAGTLSAHDFQIRTANSARVTVQNSSGNVGIGTTVPVGLLNVSGGYARIGNGGTNTNATSSGEAYVQGDLEVDGTIYGSLSGNASTVTTNANLTGDVTSSGNATTLSSTYKGWTDGGTNVYTTTSTDSVGIGTTTPTGRLDVRGDEVRIWTGSGTNTNATSSGELYVEGDAEVDGTLYAGSINGGGSDAVGIGTALPRSILEVQKGSGTAQITIDGTTGGCFMIQDTDGAGWTECDVLNGTMSCSTDADGICD